MAIPSTQQELQAMQCQALQPGHGRLSEPEIDQGLSILHGWSAEGQKLHKRYAFADFAATMAFVNAVAGVADSQDHHPELHVSYNRCGVAWSTHSAGGVTLNDMICAAKTEAVAGDAHEA